MPVISPLISNTSHGCKLSFTRLLISLFFDKLWTFKFVSPWIAIFDIKRQSGQVPSVHAPFQMSWYDCHILHAAWNRFTNGCHVSWWRNTLIDGQQELTAIGVSNDSVAAAAPITPTNSFRLIYSTCLQGYKCDTDLWRGWWQNIQPLIQIYRCICLSIISTMPSIFTSSILLEIKDSVISGCIHINSIWWQPIYKRVDFYFPGVNFTFVSSSILLASDERANCLGTFI